MSVEFSMSEFLRNGRIGPLQTGYPRIALIDLLGPPDDVSVKGLRTIFKYGNIQFTFAVDKLSVIAISLSRNHLRWHSAFVLSGLVPTPAMLFADFVRVF